MKKTKKGFTLIELIVVLAILAIVAVIAVPTAFSSINKARIAADQASMESINSAIRVYATIGLSTKDFATTGGTAGVPPTIDMALADGGLGDAAALAKKMQSTEAATEIKWVAGVKKGDIGHFEWDKGGTGSLLSAAGGVAIFTPAP
ncbi:MAG: type II secretion system protein [Ruthenibacterium sp.]